MTPRNLIDHHEPILCRLCAYFAPGLPRPTKSRMTRHPASGYFFLSPPPAGALAPAAGALAPAAGAFAPAAGAAPGAATAPAAGAAAPGTAVAAGPAAAAAAAALSSSA